MSRRELRDIFRHFDSDASGHLDREEFSCLVQEGLDANMSREEVDVGFSSIDANGNGTIEFGEFARWWTEWCCCG